MVVKKLTGLEQFDARASAQLVLNVDPKHAWGLKDYHQRRDHNDLAELHLRDAVSQSGNDHWFDELAKLEANYDQASKSMVTDPFADGDSEEQSRFQQLCGCYEVFMASGVATVSSIPRPVTDGTIAPLPALLTQKLLKLRQDMLLSRYKYWLHEKLTCEADEFCLENTQAGSRRDDSFGRRKAAMHADAIETGLAEQAIEMARTEVMDDLRFELGDGPFQAFLENDNELRDRMLQFDF